MDTPLQPTTSPVSPVQQQTRSYFPLGAKTLSMFILKRSAGIIVLFIALIGLTTLKSSVPDILANSVDIIVSFGMVIIFGVAFFVLLTAWLEYQHYGIILEPEDFRVKRGVISQQEKGVPYRRIKEVNLDRGMFEQMFGMSNIVITLLGEGEGQSFNDESEIILPLIEQETAQEIQNYILEKGGHYSSNA